MNDFVKYNKILVTVVLSTAIGLAWAYVDCYILLPMFPYLSWFHKWINSDQILIFVGLIIAMILGKDLKEGLMLLTISALCSMAAMFLFIFFIFSNLSI